MDSLQDILGQKNFTPPDEISAIKDYVKRHYNAACRVRVEKQAIILNVPSSGLAGTLQLEKQKLIDACSLQKKLIIRTGA